MLQYRLAQDDGCECGHQDTDQVDAHQDQSLLGGKEGGYQQQISRQACRAGHEGNSQDSHNAVATVFECASCHDGRNTAAEADEVGDKRLAVKPHAVHDTVHNECRARHVAAVLKQ